MLRLVIAVAAVAVAGDARAEDVRWGVGYTGAAKELTGPQPTFNAYCKRCKIGDRMAKPPKPYLGVQVTKPEPDEHSSRSYEPVLIAIHVKRGWYFRIIGEHGQDVWPHGEPRIDQTLTIESITQRDVIAGGPPEIVVVTKTTSKLAPSYREVWVFTVVHGVVWSSNPIADVDPKSLL